MQKNLVIMESPEKASVVQSFLGKDFKVVACRGHIRDLKKKGLGIDIKNNFAPDYEVPAEKKAIVAELKKEAKNSDIVWLASDPDREGEAIAWHLYEVLGLKKENTRRVTFPSITKDVVLDAISNPREIDDNLVCAQQARRVLDRIVGFELSPILWKKVKPSLSAGRVQSVTTRLVVDREREIQGFHAESSYRVRAFFSVKDKNGKKTELKADLSERIKTKEEALAFLNHCKGATFKIDNVEQKPIKRCPAAPFTTSTLQQEAARKLNFSVSQTMRVAQSLYESGKITYMRTDSVVLSDLAIGTAKAEIISMAGEKYHHARQYQTKAKGAQEAHEAIRPTYISQHEIEGTSQEKRLYELIWKRTIASQMEDAEFEKTVATISVSGETRKFVAEGEVLVFDGFLRVYIESTDDDDNKETKNLLPPLTAGEALTDVLSVEACERFTQRPARYTEATLVSKMEELGIGRPSTYAPTISTIQQRDYVVREDREGEARSYNVLTLKAGALSDEMKSEMVGVERSKLFPTDIGIVVNDFLQEYFPDILDYNFTSNVEKSFDDVAEGNLAWTSSIDSFYQTFHPTVENAEQNSERKVGERQVGVDPVSGKPVFVKIGRFGPIAQIGTADDEEKPRFASLRKNQSLESITFEEVMDLFKLPRDLGEFEEKPMIVADGRFGAYVRHDSKFYSLKKTDDPLTITADRAIELIQEKREQEANKFIRVYEAEGIEIINGRFGPYIAFNSTNYKIPKGTDPTTLSVEDCKALIEKQGEKAPSRSRRSSAKTTATAEKKTTTKRGAKKA